MFEGIINSSILLKGKQKGIVSYNIINLFDYLDDPNQRIDDYPYGGGEGMILKPEPLTNAIESIKEKGNQKIIFPTPDGELYNHSKAKEFSNCDSLVFICGHYKGIDQRIRDNFVTDEISIGDFVLTSGELPTMLMMDSIIRLKKGVLNNYLSAVNDSFYDLLLDGPHFTRPRNFRSKSVPDILLSGDHEKIKEWRKKESLKLTKLKRPDLLKIKN